MDILDILTDNTQSSEQLSTFITQYNNELYDFLFTQNYSELIDSKDRIDTFILTNRQKLKGLNFNDNNSIFFLNMLLDTSERLGLLLSFQTLYNLLIKNDCSISNRLIASSLYLIGIKKIDDYELKLPIILDHLQIAYEEEEDNEFNVIAVIIKFYAQLINNFGKYNLIGVSKINGILKTKIGEYSFLINENIDTVLDFEFSDFNLAYKNIQLVLDNFLTKSKLYPIYNKSKLLIERDTNYSNLLLNSSKNYKAIQEISAKKYSMIADNNIYYSLQRGVKILEEEKQLYAYIYSFGKMHYMKLTTAFDFLPKEFFNEKINIIDWGCGQAMASMSYCDYILKKGLSQSIIAVTLIEPSEIALKRGALHIEKYLPKTNILTINKDLDSLKLKDFIENTKTTTLHLFSNILDIDHFSLTDLSKLIEAKFKGTNYFVCVSPYVTSLKTLRLDNFCAFFNEKENFEMIKSINKTKGEWINDWSKVIRIFKVDI